MASLITVADLQEWPGFDAVDPVQAAKLIEVVSGLVEDVARPHVLDPQALPPAIEAVVVSMVRRGLDNPRGLTGEQLGDYQWQGTAASGSIYVSLNEKRVIRRAIGKLGVATVSLEADIPIPTDSPAFGLSSTEIVI